MAIFRHLRSHSPCIHLSPLAAVGSPAEREFSGRTVRNGRLWVLSLLLWMQLGVVGFTAETSAKAESKPAAVDNRRTYDLSPRRENDEISRIELGLEVSGDLSVTNAGKVQKLPMSVVAKMHYDEKLLSDERKAGGAIRSLRHYAEAEATIKVGKDGFQPKLADESRLLVADITEKRVTLFSPVGPLTREELDLVTVVGNSLIIDRLMPEEPQQIGKNWKNDKATIAALLGLDAMSQCEVETVLVEVEKDVARLTLAGHVQGAAEGVATEIDLKAKFNFDLTRRRITGFNMAVREKRSIGHVGPGVEVVAKLRMKINPEQESPALDDDAVAKYPTEPTPEVTRLVHDAKAGYRFLCDRRWFATGEGEKLVVLRLVDRGDLVAQCNLTPVTGAKATKGTTLEEYQQEVKIALGKNFGQFLRTAQWKDDVGQIYYRVVATGQVEKLPIVWNYYLISGAGGRRLAVVTTVEEELVNRLGDLDRDLVESLVMQELPAKSEAERPKQEEAKAKTKGVKK